MSETIAKEEVPAKPRGDKKAVRKIKGRESRTQVPAEALPRQTLEEAVQVARVLHDNYAGKSASWEDLATGLELGAQTTKTKYLIWSAAAYGLIQKNDDGTYSLSEPGRKIAAPAYEGEDAEGRRQSVLTPTVLSKFFSDYDGHPVPGQQYFPNVLETKFGLPRDRTAEAIELIVSNGRYAGLLTEENGKPSQVVLRGAVRPAPAAKEVSGPATTAGAGSATQHSAEEAIPDEAVEWDKVCFYITPIGDDGSEMRKHADMMLKHLVEPVASQTGLVVVRADRIAKSGLITQQILEHLARARLCIADLSFNSPNAFYELGVRHACKLATIQLIRKGDKIPFDVSQGRTITIDTTDIYSILDRFESARRELMEHIKHASTGDDESSDNPIQIYLPGLRVTLPT